MSSRWRLVLCLGMLLSGPALAQQQPANPAQQPAAQTGANPQATPQITMSQKLDAARKNLAQLSDKVKQTKDDDSLAKLKVDVDAATQQIGDISAAGKPRLDQIKARLTELGDPPGEGAPPEAAVVSQERQRLIAERGEINALSGTADDLTAQATQLSESITSTRRLLFSNALFKQTSINRDMLEDAAASINHEGYALAQSLGTWISFAWNYKRFQLMSALFLSLSAALVLLVGTRKLFSPFMIRENTSGTPGYITRLSVAFWSTMIPTMAAAGFASTSYFFLQALNVLRSDIAPIVSVTLAIGVALIFVWMLVHAVLAPRQSAWRLVHVSDHGAKLLALAIFAMAVVNGLDYLAGTISEVLASPVVLTVVKSLTASLIIGLILISMSMIRPIVPSGKSLHGKGQPWPRAVSVLFVLTGAGLIIATLSGYVGLARFVASQIVMTSAILVTMYIGFLTGKAVAKQNALSETIVGRFLEQRFGLGQVALDQAGLFAGLLIYLLVLLFFVPLILLQWGFQITDIQAGAYEVFTDIEIGSISISIVGIVTGIVLFALGYLVTRWFQRWLDGSVMARSRIDPGVRNSVKTGVGYLGVGLAGLVAVSAAGLDLSSLALVAGALSLGVGFGLQNIVSNFVSGLILLVERPFKVGDWVVTGTTEGFVKRISVRATEIETFQRQTIMVPNSLFINASVGNWTHRNKLGRSDISVTVGYDSPPRQVMDTLLEIAAAHPLVLNSPEPQAVFSAFGDATMTFELRIFLADIVNGNGVRNDLRLAIYERFRREGMGSPFPQQEPQPDVPPPGADSDKLAEETGPVGSTETPAIASDEAARRGGTQRRPRRVSVDAAADQD